jgi:formylglycine-generating enzyme required for sulfatase activity
MHGNVWEWCVDWFDYYPSNAVTDPCPIYGTTRLMRDGGWYNSAKDCRSANRFYYVAVYWNADVGFRLTLVPKNE